MKYDLIVSGGGPGGLTAAWTAAAAGLKVILFERKKEITQINRLCGQFANINMISASGIYKYAYSEPLHLEVGTNGTKVHWPAIGLSIDYNGPIKPYMNYVHFSPGGNILYRVKDRFFAFYWEKESLLKGLLESGLKAGLQAVSGAIVRSAENTADGVRVTVDINGKTETYTAAKLIVAEGKDSHTAEMLGVMEGRRVSTAPVGGVGYVVENVGTDWGINNWVCITVPSLSPVGNLWMFQVTGNRYVVGTSQSRGVSSSEMTEKLFTFPFFKPWFGKAKVVKKLAFAMNGLTRPMQEPISGNVLLLGESAGVMETSNPGAVACGYQAAKAIKQELGGEQGFAEYTKWWQNGFEGLSPTYGKASARFFSMNSLCTDEEVDYLYKTFEGIVGVPAITLANNLGMIKHDRPALYAKLEKTGIAHGLNAQKLDYSSVLDKDVQNK